MSGFIDGITRAQLYPTDYGRASNISYSAERKYIYIHTNIDVVDVRCYAYDSNNQNVDQIHITNNYARIDISSYYRVLITEINLYNTSENYTEVGYSGELYHSFYDDFITGREYGDVQRVIEFEKCGWANLEDDEKEEWYAGMKGALNYSDLNRIQDGALRILEQYLKNAECTQLSYNAFTPSTSYVIVILKNGLSGTLTKTSNSSTTSVSYGINMVSVSSGSSYTTSFSATQKESVCIFEVTSQIASNLALNFFAKNQMLYQTELLPALQIANLVSGYVRRPALLNSEDYRSVGSSGAISTDMTEIDYNRINEYEKSLKLSFDWIQKGYITIPFDWEIQQSYLYSVFYLKFVPDGGSIKINLPRGYLVKIIAEYNLNQYETLIFSNGNEISYSGSSTPYKYLFKIYGNVYSEEMQAQISAEKEIYCEFAEKIAFVLSSGDSSGISLQGYDANNNIIQSWESYSYGVEIDVSAFHHVGVIPQGQSGNVNLLTTFENSFVGDISELDTDLIKISISNTQ